MLPYLLIGLAFVGLIVLRRSQARTNPPRQEAQNEADFSITLRIHPSLVDLCGYPHAPTYHLVDHYLDSLPYLQRAQGYPPWKSVFLAEVDFSLRPGEYKISISGQIVAQGKLLPDAFLATLGKGSPLGECPVVPHPVTQAKSCWLSKSELPLAWANRLSVESPLEVLVHHLRLTLVKNLHLMLYSTWIDSLVENALQEYKSLQPYSRVLIQQRDHVYVIMRLSLQQGASFHDLERYLNCLGQGLVEQKDEREIVRDLRAQCPVGTRMKAPFGPEVCASMVQGLCLDANIMEAQDLPVSVKQLGHNLLRGQALDSKQMLEVFGRLQFRNQFVKGTDELKEFCRAPEKPRTLTPSDRLACVLLSLPQEQAAEAWNALAARIDESQLSSLVGSLSRTSFALTSFTAPADVLAETFLRSAVEDFLDFREPVGGNLPTRQLDPQSLEAEDFQNLAYQLERLYFPVLYWKSNLEEVFRFVPDGVDQLLLWFASSKARLPRQKRATLALTTLPQPLQSLLREELLARGCDLDWSGPTDLSEAIACEFEMLSRLGTRLG